MFNGVDDLGDESSGTGPTVPRPKQASVVTLPRENSVAAKLAYNRSFSHRSCTSAMSKKDILHKDFKKFAYLFCVAIVIIVAIIFIVLVALGKIRL